MITMEQYFGDKPHSNEQLLSAMILLSRVESLLTAARDAGAYKDEENHKTASTISGEGNGGFRTPECPIGAPHSAHKEAKAIDIYDPENKLDAWISDEILEIWDLYREAPDSTIHWCHLQTRPTVSGHRTFIP